MTITNWNKAIHDLYDALALPPTPVRAADRDLHSLRERLGALIDARPEVDVPADLAHARTRLDAAVATAKKMAANAADRKERERLAEAVADVIRALPLIVEWARVTGR